jgi:hypothetical protein
MLLLPYGSWSTGERDVRFQFCRTARYLGVSAAHGSLDGLQAWRHIVKDIDKSSLVLL